jgi:hypothetical protein
MIFHSNPPRHLHAPFILSALYLCSWKPGKATTIAKSHRKRMELYSNMCNIPPIEVSVTQRIIQRRDAVKGDSLRYLRRNDRVGSVK